MDTKSYNRNLQHPKDRTITRVRISPKLREKAIARARLQSEKENSGLGDEADLKGCLGEVVTEYWMDNNNISYTEKLHSREYDYVLNNSGCTVDVKTKDRNFKPQRGYDCTVPFYNHRYQKPDFFLFVSLLTFDNSNDLRGLEKFEFAFIVGSATYGDLEKVGIAYLRDEQDWSNGTVMWTSALNILMYQLISVTDTILLFNSDKQTLNNYQSKEDLLFNIPSVNINEELIKEIKSRIDSGNILHRPLPPWDKDKHIEIEDIDKKIECKEIIHPLDREIINHRIENLDLNLQEKNNLELLRNGIECSGWFVHKRAIRDYLKRYNIFFESEKHRAVNRVNGNSIFDSIIINGKTQKDWIRTRNNN